MQVIKNSFFAVALAVSWVVYPFAKVFYYLLGWAIPSGYRIPLLSTVSDELAIIRASYAMGAGPRTFFDWLGVILFFLNVYLASLALRVLTQSI